MVQLLGRVCRGDYRGTRLRQALYNRAVLRKGKRTDRPEDRRRFALTDDLDGDPLFRSGNDDSTAVDSAGYQHAPPSRLNHRIEAGTEGFSIVGFVIANYTVVLRVE